MPSKDELETQHKKALKSLDGEKRAAIKKAKALKGQKGKDALAAVEAEFAAKLTELEQTYKDDLGGSGTGSGSGEAAAATKVAPGVAPGVATAAATTTATTAETAASSEDPPSPELSEKERKLEKARRKKEKQRQKELEKERELEEIAANAGPNMRHVEMEQIQTTLDPLQLSIEEVAADGHCLYRAIGAQTQQDYQRVRSLCADTLLAHPEEFAPFCEFTDTIHSFDEYVNQVRNSAEWGGHLELRALSRALARPIKVYSTREPLEIQEETSDNAEDPIRLSYHHHYYALGEHYNQVVVNKKEAQ